MTNSKLYQFSKIIIAVSLSVLLFGNCQKLPSDLSWNTKLKAPLIHSRLDISDIFVDSLVQRNPDQSLSIVLNQEITAIDPNQLIEVHDTLENEEYPLPIPWPMAPGQKLFEVTSNYTLDLGDVELTKARAKTAIIKFLVTSTIKYPLLVRYDLLSSEKNGVSFFEEGEVPAADSGGIAFFDKSINLSYYNMDFTGPNHNSFNLVSSKTLIQVHPKSDTAHFQPTDEVAITSIFDKLEISYAKGYFGQYFETATDTTNTSTFANFKTGSFDLDHVKAYLKIENSIGADMQMQIGHISSINSKTGKSINLQSPLVGQNLNILRASETGDTNAPVNPTNYSWDLTQSNIAQMIENQPDKLSYSINYKLNPLGNISGGNDFIYAGHPLKGNIFMEIPLNLRLDSLVIEEPTSINFDEEENLKSGNLLIITENLFPFDVSIQFYLRDQNLTIIDSLFTGNITSQHGIIDSQGYVLTPTHNELNIPLDAQKLVLLRNAKDLLVRATIQSGHANHIQLYEHYNIDIKVIMEADYEF